jgi:hypothetical protein
MTRREGTSDGRGLRVTPAEAAARLERLVQVAR